MRKYYNISKISQNSSINITNIAQSAITAHKLLQKTQNQLDTRINHVIFTSKSSKLQLLNRVVPMSITTQGVYKFNWTNFQEISRRFQKWFQKKSRTCLRCFGMLHNVPNILVCLNKEQKHDMHNMGLRQRWKRATGFLNKRSGTQFYHDSKPMQSIIDMLHKNFHEDHTNSRRFPGFPGVADTLQLFILWYNLIANSTAIANHTIWLDHFTSTTADQLNMASLFCKICQSVRLR